MLHETVLDVIGGWSGLVSDFIDDPSIPGEHKAIVDEELWRAVQDRSTATFPGGK